MTLSIYIKDAEGNLFLTSDRLITAGGHVVLKQPKVINSPRLAFNMSGTVSLQLFIPYLIQAYKYADITYIEPLDIVSHFQEFCDLYPTIIPEEQPNSELSSLELVMIDKPLKTTYNIIIQHNKIEAFEITDTFYAHGISANQSRVIFNLLKDLGYLPQQILDSIYKICSETTQISSDYDLIIV